MSKQDPLFQLLEALTSAPQDKEGAFRVRTWKMVIERLVNIEKALTETTNIVKEKPSTQEINDVVENKLKTNLSSEDENKILF